MTLFLLVLLFFEIPGAANANSSNFTISGWNKVTEFPGHKYPDFHRWQYNSQTWDLYSGNGTLAYSLELDDVDQELIRGYYTKNLTSNGSSFTSSLPFHSNIADVDNNYILFQGIHFPSHISLNIYNKSTGVISNILTHTNDPLAGFPVGSMEGGKVLYFNSVEDEHKIYNIATGTTSPRIDLSPVGQPHPHGYAQIGSKNDAFFIIREGQEANQSNHLYRHQLGTNIFTRISQDNEVVLRFDVENNLVVFEGNTIEHGSQLVIYNTSTGERETISELSTRQNHTPKIKNGYIMYSCDTSICIYSINQKSTHKIERRQAIGDNTYGLMEGEFLGFNELEKKNYIFAIIEPESGDRTYRRHNSEIFYANFEFSETSNNNQGRPTFSNLPGENRPINIEEGQVIKNNPFIIRVRPNDDVGIERVDFYLDNQKICTTNNATRDGVYECAWDTLRFNSSVRVVAFNTQGASSEITRNTTVNLGALPRTGSYLFKYALIGMMTLVFLYTLSAKLRKLKKEKMS